LVIGDYDGVGVIARADVDEVFLTAEKKVAAQARRVGKSDTVSSFRRGSTMRCALPA
jgi:regulator of RNase E activity RraA